MTLRILVVDDHPVIRRGLKNLLGAHPGWEVIDEAADGVEAVDKSRQLSPDIVVLDLSMPRMSGLEAVPVDPAEHSAERSSDRHAT